MDSLCENVVDHSTDMSLIKNDFNEFRKIEDELFKTIDSSNFYDTMRSEFGYSYEDISRYIHAGIFTQYEQQKFNIALRTLKKLYGIYISDAIIYMEETMNLSNILKFMDDETVWVLKSELSKKFNINGDVDDNSLLLSGCCEL